MKWKYTRRKIAGHKGRVKVKVHKKIKGGYLVRRVGVRNRHD